MTSNGTVIIDKIASCLEQRYLFLISNHNSNISVLRSL